MLYYQSLVRAIEEAAEDPNVSGLILRFGNCAHANNCKMGHIEELREAISKFRAKQKHTLAHADSIGVLSDSLKAYYLMSAFEQIHLNPIGTVMLPGLSISQPFLKEALDKLGVEPLLEHREEFKTASNMFTESRFTEAHKLQVEDLMRGVLGHLVSDIAVDRRVTENVISNEWLEKAVFSSQDALNEKIVDVLAHRDESQDKIANTCGYKNRKDAEFLYLESYLQRKSSYERLSKFFRSLISIKEWKKKKENLIAVVHLGGTLVDGDKAERPFHQRENTIYSFNAADMIRNAANNPKVKAILLRVDSPGGSAIASEVINREIELAKQKHKKVVVSMANVAGSGGYWISMNADKIVCNKMAITGSIGVIMGKFYVKGLLDKLGVSVDHVQSHSAATLNSPLSRYSEREKSLVDKVLDDMYSQFIDRVAHARHMSHEQVRAIAKGQVYLGSRAKEIGLVDELGGYSKALAVTRELLGLPEDEPLQTLRYPDVTLLSMINRPNTHRSNIMLLDQLLYYYPNVQRYSPWLARFLTPAMDHTEQLVQLENSGVWLVMPYLQQGL